MADLRVEPNQLDGFLFVVAVLVFEVVIDVAPKRL
jgi:hypothetical protein